MTRIRVWIILTATMVTYRLLLETPVTLNEHIAASYFSAIALGCHWFFNRGE